MELKSTEYFIMEHVPANLFRGIEAVGGRLYITNERVIFKPHSFNIQSKPLEISIQEIVNIEKRNTLLVVPNGMRISIKNGQEHKFVIWNRAKLIELIKDTKIKMNV
ncbi:GRAM domain-containing protein [Paenibacillus sp. 22594]|uniref:GRAM domain-containing protein n=1 Tax=Paenibacillus sp. 22594 TaxID=3453947 RepID=UPI003F85CF45